jgi:hypothetical protein
MRVETTLECGFSGIYRLISALPAAVPLPRKPHPAALRLASVEKAINPIVFFQPTTRSVGGYFVR